MLTVLSKYACAFGKPFTLKSLANLIHTNRAIQVQEVQSIEVFYMKDLREIMEYALLWDEQGKVFAEAVVVRIDGPSYRGCGARLLVSATGETVGAVSGGCLESDVIENALQVMEKDEPRLLTYDASQDEELLLGTGTGCGGTVTLLVLPSSRLDLSPWRAWLRHEQPFVQTLVFETSHAENFPRGGKLWVQDRVLPFSDLPESHFADVILEDAQTVLQELKRGRSPVYQAHSFTYQIVDGWVSVLTETVPPPLHLLIFGGGADAVPMARLGLELGYRVHVVDHRPAEALVERFGTGMAFIQADPSHDLMLPFLSDYAHAVVMTHNFERDKGWLQLLLKSHVPYVGMLGPKRRTEKMLEALKETGFVPDENDLKRLYAPVGLNLGGETPAEVALAVLAEMQASFYDVKPVPLREKKGAIHDHRDQTKA